MKQLELININILDERKLLRPRWKDDLNLNFEYV